jgi:sugar O-acyltransferase (sialic acid O-acetyltransferase NeuD family)
MGQEIADLALASPGMWRVIGFLDDEVSFRGQSFLDLPVLGDRQWLHGQRIAVALGLGAPSVRRRVWESLRDHPGLSLPPLVHPSAYVGLGCVLGDGTVVAAGATLTADVHVGRFGIINAGATVSHNSRLGDFATVAPGVHLAGNVLVDEGADIGIGASVIQGVVIGAWSVVGAGTVVLGDVAADSTVVGVPAKVIATRPPGWHV